MTTRKINILLFCESCNKSLDYITTEEVTTPAQNKFEAAIKILVQSCKECADPELDVELFINNKKEKDIELT